MASPDEDGNLTDEDVKQATQQRLQTEIELEEQREEVAREEIEKLKGGREETPRGDLL